MSLINQQITELIKEEKLQLEENRVETTGSGRMMINDNYFFPVTTIKTPVFYSI